MWSPGAADRYLLRVSDLAPVPEPTTQAEFAAQLVARTSAKSTRMLADRSGWSRSTISELRGGRRLPTAQQLADLLGAVGADSDEIARWEQARQRCQSVPTAADPTDAEEGGTLPTGPQAEEPYLPPAASAPEEGPARRPHRLLVWTAAVAVAAVAGFALGRATAPTTPGAIAPTPAVVANTTNLGVMTYTGPNRSERAPGTLPEGTRILVVCQVGDGEPLTDRVNGQVLTWPVWDKLDDGRWVPDIYTNLGKNYQPTRTATALLTC